MLHVVREWNAGVYHRVSTPQFDWGVRVLDRLSLEGGELVLDVGCGTGRLTELLLARLPRGRVVAVDQSTNMLDAARAFLQDRFGPRVTFVQADASALPFPGAADAIFSTATFHWVLDHDRLFPGCVPRSSQADTSWHSAAEPPTSSGSTSVAGRSCMAARDSPAFELDYWRLNMEARKL